MTTEIQLQVFQLEDEAYAIVPQHTWGCYATRPDQINSRSKLRVGS